MSTLAILTKDTKIEIGSRGKDEERMKRLEDKLDQIKDQVSKLEQATEFVSSGRYTVQVRALEDRDEAEAHTAELKKYGLNATCQKSYIASKSGIWYQVRLGRFEDQKAAERYKDKILAMGVIDEDAFVTDWNVPYTQ